MRKTKNKNLMNASEHLRELRNRALIVAAAFVVVCLLALCFSNQIMQCVLGIAERAGFDFVYVAPQEAVVQKLRVVVTLAVFAVVPVGIFEAVGFTAPVFSEVQAVRRLRLYAGTVICMFGIGVVFAFCIVAPVTMSFLYEFSTKGSIIARISVEKYISLFLTIVICLGVMFETPVVCAALVNTGVLSIEQLKKRRTVSVYCVLTAVVSALLTPPDPVTMVVMMVPMWILYPVSILMCKLFRKER